MLVLALVLAPAAVAADDLRPIPVRQWSRQACAAIGDWGVATVRSAHEAGGPIVDVESARSTLLTELDSAVDDTTTLLSALRAAGRPKVAHGATAARRLRSGVEHIRAALRTARHDTQSAPADVAGFVAVTRTAGVVLARSMAAAPSRFIGSLGGTADGTLARAMLQAPGCVPVTG